MRHLDVIATGTGRCGTGFVAQFLTSAGLACGHERFFSHGGYEAALEMLRDHWLGTRGESSWLVAPFLDREPLWDALPVHLVRHPKHVIESMLRVGPGTTPAYDVFCRQHIPELAQYTPDTVDYAACRYVYWNRLIEEKLAGRECIFFTIEQEPIELLESLAQHGIYDMRLRAGRVLFDDRAHNTKDGTAADVALDDVADIALREALAEMSARYGYGWKKGECECHGN